MINVYDDILSHPGYFKQLATKDGLLVNYQCPQMEKWADLFSHVNHIIYTERGKKLLVSPGKTCLLTEGKLVFLKKGAIRQGKFHDANWCPIVFCVPDNYLLRLFKEYRAELPVYPLANSSQDAIIELNSNNATHAYFHSLLPYFTQSPSPAASLLEIKCRELVSGILFNPENKELLSYLQSISDYSKPPLAEIMEANYRYNLSLEEFARICQRSLTAFKNEFTATFNLSPGKWLLQRRLEYARMLLSVSQKNISEVVYESGFESATHFSRAFKAKFGTAPLQYRKQLLV
jgi:AraC-like DNA-binding protein